MQLIVFDVSILNFMVFNELGYVTVLPCSTRVQIVTTSLFSISWSSMNQTATRTENLVGLVRFLFFCFCNIKKKVQ